MNAPKLAFSLLAALLACAARRPSPFAPALEGELLPTGARIRPLAARGAALLPLPGGQIVATAVSPDQTTLLALTSGFNRSFDARGTLDARGSAERIFVIDLRGAKPRLTQTIPIPDSFGGIAWSPDGRAFAVSGGSDDDVRVFQSTSLGFTQAGAAIQLGHAHGLGIEVAPMAAGLAFDGARVLVANLENDSLSLVELAERRKTTEIQLRPGLSGGQRGGAGGAFPISVAMEGQHAWVSCVRDNEIVEVDLTSGAVAARIAVGRQPGRLLLDSPRRRLFVAESGDDTVAAIDLDSRSVLFRVPTAATAELSPRLRGLKGANPNSLALSGDGETLYVTNGGLNAVAIIDLPAKSVRALVPTGWYPHSVSIAGGRLLVAHGKNNSGPNPGACRDDSVAEEIPALAKDIRGPPCRGLNNYVLQLTRGGLLSLPIPARDEEARLTQVVAENDRFFAISRSPLIESLGIKHVIYVIKENRTYDQVLGDLGQGDGDAKLALFPERITPNHHALAREFVNLDAFFDSGDVSGDGWNWSVAGRTSDFLEKEVPVQYAERGLSYDFESTTRNVNVSLPFAERRASNRKTPDDVDLLPGEADVASSGDYLWSAALAKGLSVRNYGAFGDDTLYDRKSPSWLHTSRRPFDDKVPQFVPGKRELREISDPYFRGFDQSYADYWRYQEWAREFDAYEQRGDLPALSILRLLHDHFGAFKDAEDGVDTPDTQMADNDYALGLMVARVARSRFAGDTLILILEDDAQDGGDHVDAHRSLLLAAGAHVRRNALVSRPYTTVNALRTIEIALGLAPLGLTDGLAEPMEEIFQIDARPWSFEARVPRVLQSTRLPLEKGPVELPRRNQRWWSEATQGLDFSRADAADATRVNSILEAGLR